MRTRAIDSGFLCGRAWSFLALLVVASPAESQTWRADADDAGQVMVPGLVIAGVAFAAGADRFFARHAEDLHRQLRPKGPIAMVGAGIGRTGPIYLADALVIAGFAGREPRMTALGANAFEAIALSYGISLPLKALVGRRRPDAAEGPAFRVGHGIRHHDYTSFPSTHASSSFALATVLATGVSGASRDQRRLIGGVAYAAAISVGVSRVVVNEHWMSDVIAGAAIGIGAGSWVSTRQPPGGRQPVSVRAANRSASRVAVPLVQFSF